MSPPAQATQSTPRTSDPLVKVNFNLKSDRVNLVTAARDP